MPQPINKVGIPYDPEHPISATLQPGETIVLYGDITFTNNTDHAVDIKLRFDLRHGFQATIDGKSEVSVKMHKHYFVDPSEAAVAQLVLDTIARLDYVAG